MQQFNPGKTVPKQLTLTPPRYAGAAPCLFTQPKTHLQPIAMPIAMNLSDSSSCTVRFTEQGCTVAQGGQCTEISWQSIFDSLGQLSMPNNLPSTACIQMLVLAFFFSLANALSDPMGEQSKHEIGYLKSPSAEADFDNYMARRPEDMTPLYLILGLLGGVLCIAMSIIYSRDILKGISNCFGSIYRCFAQCYEDYLDRKRVATTEMRRLLPQPTATRQPTSAQSDNDLERQIEEEWRNHEDWRERSLCLPCCRR